MPVKSEKRLANFIIDIIGYYIFAVLVGLLIGLSGFYYIIEDMDETTLGFLIMFLYYLIFEGIYQKTPGKWITKSKVVMNDGSKPNFGNILIRTISRAIPFEAFSFIGSNPIGWHDKLSKTIVINDNLNTRIILENKHNIIFCNKCGGKMDNTAKYCTECGLKLKTNIHK